LERTLREHARRARAPLRGAPWSRARALSPRNPGPASGDGLAGAARHPHAHRGDAR